MRKKYDNPAPLTVNFAFDTQLLDLVANTYETQPQKNKNSRQNRSLSEKNLSSYNPKEGLLVNKFRKTQNMMKAKFFSNQMSQSLPRMPIYQQKKAPRPKSITIQNEYQRSNKLRIVHLNRNNIYDSSIEHELTKNMLKSIRKNILSTNITPLQLNSLQNTYKILMEKFNSGK